MSFSNPIPRSIRRQTFIAAEGQKVFGPSQFKIFDPLDIAIWSRANPDARFSELGNGAYSVALTGPAPATFTVTTIEPQSAGAALRVDGRRLHERMTDVTQGGVIRAVPLEAELDRQTIILQEIRRDIDVTLPELSALIDAIDYKPEDLIGFAAVRAYVVSAGQEIVPIPGGYVPGAVMVYRNGLKQRIGPPSAVPGAPDVDASTGHSLIWAPGVLQDGDVIEVETKRPFQVADVPAIVDERVPDFLSYIDPRWPPFNAVGSGLVDDTAAVQLAANFAELLGLDLYSPRRFEYFVTSLTTRVPTRLNLVLPNNGQTSAPIIVAPKAADVETPSLASINALVAAGGWNKGSSQLTGLTNARGWSYAFNSSDAVILSRLGGGSLNIGESFLVTTDAGGISPALVRDYATFTNLTVTRQRFRPPIAIQINVRVVTGSGSMLNSIIRCDRSNTIFTDSHTLNQSSGQVQQGFVASNCVHVVYENCTVDGLKVDVTNYGFNSNYSSDLTYRDCVTPECRRGIDGHAAKNVRVEGGQHPSGVGGHWVDGLLITDGAVIGNQAATTNPGCITVAGSNVRADGAELVMARRGAILTMRADLPSLEGICHVTNSKIVLYDDDDSLGPSYVSLMYLGGHTAGHNTGKTVYLPSNVKLTDNRLIQRGATSDNPIRLLHIGEPRTAAEFPQSIINDGIAEVGGNTFDLEAGFALGANSRLEIDFMRADTMTGAGYRAVRIKDVPRVSMFCTVGSAASNGDKGRYDIEIQGVTGTDQYTVRYGSIRKFLAVDCARAVISQTGAVAALGDETAGFVERDTSTKSFTPTLIAASGSGETYDVRNGSYQIIGDWVEYTAYIDMATLGTLSGGLSISLPIACVASPAFTYSALIGFVQTVTRSAANYTQLAAYVQSSGSTITLAEYDMVAGVVKQLTASQITAAFRIGVSVRYRWR